MKKCFRVSVGVELQQTVIFVGIIFVGIRYRQAMAQRVEPLKNRKRITFLNDRQESYPF